VETPRFECPGQKGAGPRQRELRRQPILDAAEQLLDKAQVADITLRDIGRQAGIATSNVLRYFENREAGFLELLNREYGAWLDALPAELSPADAGSAGPMSSERGFADAYAASLAARPAMCELASVLERTVSVETVRTYKRQALAGNDRLADIIHARVPALDRAAAQELASATIVLIAGAVALRPPRTHRRRGRGGSRAPRRSCRLSRPLQPHDRAACHLAADPCHVLT
jgi:AcrR family transcriptional regulator